MCLLIGACGIAGAVYALLVARRAKRQPDYVPVLEDWIWHVALPFISYVALFIAAMLLFRRETAALFMMGAAALLLLFIGIHNAWDTITYIVVELPRKDGEPK